MLIIDQSDGRRWRRLNYEAGVDFVLMMDRRCFLDVDEIRKTFCRFTMGGDATVPFLFLGGIVQFVFGFGW